MDRCERVIALATKRARGRLTLEEDMELLGYFRADPGLESLVDEFCSLDARVKGLEVLLSMDYDAIRRKTMALINERDNTFTDGTDKEEL